MYCSRGEFILPVFLGVVHRPQNVAGIARDEEIPVISRDLFSRQKCRRIAGRNVLKEERAISSGVDVITICTSADPAECPGGCRQSAGRIRGDIVSEALGGVAASEWLVRHPRRLNGLDERQSRSNDRERTHLEKQHDLRDKRGVRARKSPLRCSDLCSFGRTYPPNEHPICNCRKRKLSRHWTSLPSATQEILVTRRPAQGGFQLVSRVCREIAGKSPH